MILIDTQVCIWWTTDAKRLSEKHRQLISDSEADGVQVSAISVWEVGMLVEKRRIDLGVSPQRWLDRLASTTTVHVLPATPQILLDSTMLPGAFHTDPADRIIVATARAHASLLLTTDQKILDYAHVTAVGPH